MRFGLGSYRTLSVCMAWIVLGCATAGAQGIPPATPGLKNPFPDLRGMSVTDRPRPDFDALGTRAGSFIVYPALNFGTAFDDNIFATDGGEISDYIFTVNPTVKVVSQWSNHALNIFGGVDVIRYVENPSEETLNWDFGADGTIDIHSDAELDLLARFEQLTQERGSPDDVSGSAPTEFQVMTGEASYTHTFNRLQLIPSIDVRRLTFDDVPSTMGVINNSDRDRVETTMGARASYDVMPNVSTFVQAYWNFRDYDDAVDDGGVNRDSSGFSTAVGASLDFTGLVFGDFFVGYLSQFYEDPTLSTISGINAGASITWNVTPLTTVNGLVETGVNETTQTGASGYLSTVVGGSVDHELLRNVILGAEIAGRWDDYQGITREDEWITAGFNANYLMNRYVSFGLLYDYTQRISNVAGDDYSQNVVLFEIRGRY